MIKLTHLRYSFIGLLFFIVLILFPLIVYLIHTKQPEYVQLLISSVIVSGSFTVGLFIYYLDQKNKREYLHKSILIFLEHLRETFNDKAFASKTAIDAERTSLRMFCRSTISHLINNGNIHEINRDLLSFQSEFDFYFMITDALLEQSSDKEKDRDFLLNMNQKFVNKIERTVKILETVDVSK